MDERTRRIKERYKFQERIQWLLNRAARIRRAGDVRRELSAHRLAVAQSEVVRAQNAQIENRIATAAIRQRQRQYTSG